MGKRPFYAVLILIHVLVTVIFDLIFIVGELELRHGP